MDTELPPLQELESIRQRLIEQIATAERLFAAEKNGHELQTSKAALKWIEEAISSTAERQTA